MVWLQRWKKKERAAEQAILHGRALLLPVTA
jgi:hypothetical protein